MAFWKRAVPVPKLPLLEAVNAGDVKSVRAHLQRDAAAAIAVRGGAGESALHRAACGHAGIAKLLLQAGVDVNAKARGGEIALHLAALDGSVELLRLLLDAGADVHARAEGGATALHIACVRGDLDIVRALLEAGSELEAADDGENRALHRAAAEGHHALVELLLQRGADRTARGYNGLTAESLAVLGRHPHVARLLSEEREW